VSGRAIIATVLVRPYRTQIVTTRPNVIRFSTSRRESITRVIRTFVRTNAAMEIKNGHGLPSVPFTKVGKNSHLKRKINDDIVGVRNRKHIRSEHIYTCIHIDRRRNEWIDFRTRGFVAKSVQRTTVTAARPSSDERRGARSEIPVENDVGWTRKHHRDRPQLLFTRGTFVLRNPNVLRNPRFSFSFFFSPPNE